MNQKGRWAHLYDVVVDSTTTLHLTDYPLALTLNSIVYNPYPIFCGDLPQTAKPEMHTFQVNVANIDRSIAIYLEAGKLLGKDVTIIWVFVRESDDTVVSAFAEVYQMLSAEIVDDEAIVAFEVGKANLFAVQLPRNRWVDLRCRHIYKRIGTCDYGRDEFAGLSEIDLKPGGDGNKRDQGWRALNVSPVGVRVADINLTNASHLTIEVGKATNVSWDASQKNAPLLYRKLDLSNSTEVLPDFDLEVKFAGSPAALSESEGIFIATDSDTSTHWIYFARSYMTSIVAHRSGILRPTKKRYPFLAGPKAGTVSALGLGVYEMNGGSRTQPYSLASSASVILRVKKIGTTFEFYHRSSETSSWIGPVYSTVRSDLSGVMLRMGILVETVSDTRPANFQSKTDYFRLLSGGFITCNRTLDDCRKRENVRRFGGAPGVIHGALIL